MEKKKKGHEDRDREREMEKKEKGHEDGDRQREMEKKDKGHEDRKKASILLLLLSIPSDGPLTRFETEGEEEGDGE